MSYVISEERLDDLQDAIDDVLEDAEIEFEFTKQLNELTLTVAVDDILPVSRLLLNTGKISMEQCIDICGVDYSTYGQTEWATDGARSGFSRAVTDMHGTAAEGKRFAVVYHLLSVSNNIRLRVRVWLDDNDPIIDSVTSIWRGADWFEREAYDLFGIMFNGHNDLRRILTDYGFSGHPFRKDFPLIGEVEMRYDAEQKRVIYEPVQIEDRTLVPRVIREDNRYGGIDVPAQDTQESEDA